MDAEALLAQNKAMVLKLDECMKLMEAQTKLISDLSDELKVLLIDAIKWQAYAARDAGVGEYVTDGGLNIVNTNLRTSIANRIRDWYNKLKTAGIMSDKIYIEEANSYRNPKWRNYLTGVLWVINNTTAPE